MGGHGPKGNTQGGGNGTHAQQPQAPRQPHPFSQECSWEFLGVPLPHCTRMGRTVKHWAVVVAWAGTSVATATAWSLGGGGGGTESAMHRPLVGPLALLGSGVTAAAAEPRTRGIGTALG